MKPALLTAIVGAAVVAAACFSAHEPSTDVAGVSCARAQQPPGPDSAFVVIQGFAFRPADISVAEGTTVVWVNCETGGTPGHTTTSDAWDSPTLSPGESFGFKPSLGTHTYHCRPHPFMQGTVTVAANQSLASSRR
jgi:plastocyanin